MAVRARRGQRTAVTFPGVMVTFQLYPGKHGHDTDRGIGRVPYSVHIGGRLWQAGETLTDGEIGIPLPDSATECTLRIFGVEYHVRLVDPEALLPPGPMAGSTAGSSDDGFVGVAHTLYRLGYHRPPGLGTTFDNQLTAELDKAILDFQVNERIPPHADGSVGSSVMARIN